MTSTFHGIEVGKRALFAQQAALSTTGHNIANAGNAGYTRQRVNMQATNPISVPGMSSYQLGTGVDVNKIERLREDYLDIQYRTENKNVGYWEAKSDTLSKIEGLLNEPSDNGLAYVMDQFWSSWEELAKNPDSASARSVVRQRGVAVAETFNYLSNSLDDIKKDLKLVISTKQSDLNSITKQIANLNDQIARLEANNYEPNDLYDQRDVLIDQLSKMVDITNVTKLDSGMVNITVAGQELVSGTNYKEIEVVYYSDTNPSYVQGVIIKEPGVQLSPDEIKTALENALDLSSGELLARIESYGTTAGGVIPDIKKSLNQFATEFVNQVNTLHQQGYYMEKKADGSISMEPATGIDFFSWNADNSLDISADIKSSLDKIAAAQEEGSGTGTSSSGNGNNAQAIAKLKNNGTITIDGTTATFSDFYRNIIGQIGIDSQEAQRMKDNSDVIVQQVENRRQSVSGVSLDEEMANMIKFQQAYNAAARMITTMDQCLDKVINGMGRVGL